ncbi:MAG TPA: hypothetical protein VFB76_01970 [Candidatus Angelobacter sp.]|nr:hypothetical protein [Candidatus Angelobacter sp.]
MPTGQNAVRDKLYAGLYANKTANALWGWNSRCWGSMRSDETERSTMGLAAWLLQAHARLDNDDSSPLDAENATVLSPLAIELDAKQSPRNHRRLEFVCNHRMIGLLIR